MNPRVTIDYPGPIAMWLAAFLALWVAPASAVAHEFEDGFIERSVVYYAQDNQLLIEYSVGLNPNTMRTLISQMPSPNESPTEQTSGEADSPGLSHPLSQPNSAVAETGESTPPSDTQPLTDSELRVAAEFERMVGPHLLRNLKCKLDGKDVQPKWIGTGRSSRHHVNFTMQYKVENIEVGTHQLFVSDQNFRKLDGVARYAFKCRGGALMKSSNVEPSLVRAERVELGKIREDAQHKYTTVIAEFIVSDRKK